MDTERRCGTCVYWVPETQGMVARAKAKHPWSHCTTGKLKTEDDKPCLAWTRRKEESIKDG